MCVSVVLIIAQLTIAPAFADDPCDKNACPGPLRFYEEINCKPIYEKDGDCCPTSYDCAHLLERKTDKCYIGLNEYNLREAPKPEDKVPCNVGCRCSQRGPGRAKFNCAIVDCPPNRKKECYKNYHDTCCGKLVCPKEGEAVTCQVGDKTYKEGEFMNAPNQPTLQCQCFPGFRGEFVKPFCRPTRCGDDIRHAAHNIDGCAPVFYGAESVRWGCRIDTKCPDALDYVVSAKEPNTGDKVCKFGNHTLHLGDKLMNNGTGVSNECLECTCEVPPFLSCVQIPYDDCEKYNKKQ